MTAKKIVKAFLAGMGFPAVFLPIAYTLMYVFKGNALHAIPFQFIPMYVPILFGLTNILYLNMRDGASVQSANSSLWITGACLGFIVALIGVFAIHIPTLIFGLHQSLEYLPLILLPIIYGAIFRYIIKWLNKTLAI